MVPGRNGGTIRQGGTNKGGPGRPPDKFRAAMAAIAEDPQALALVKAMARGESDLAVLKDKTGLPLAIDGNIVLKAHDHAVKHGIGLPVQEVEHGGALEVIFRARAR